MDVRVTRLTEGPIIGPDLHPSIGLNIQGPSLIRVPDWIDDSLGAYYLYFADHKGSYIRLALRAACILRNRDFSPRRRPFPARSLRNSKRGIVRVVRFRTMCSRRSQRRTSPRPTCMLMRSSGES